MPQVLSDLSGNEVYKSLYLIIFIFIIEPIII